MLGATRAWEVALGLSADNGWQWVTLLSVFAVIYVAFGVIGFGTLLEEA
jgi:heme exporter protein B